MMERRETELDGGEFDCVMTDGWHCFGNRGGMKGERAIEVEKVPKRSKWLKIDCSGGREDR